MDIYQQLERRVQAAGSISESAAVLAELLSGNFAVWKDGSLYNIKQLVARINGLRVEVRIREHAPPHFHVSGGGIAASFAIENGDLLEGEIGTRERNLLSWWYKRSRPILVKAWNKSRPSDCPVGPIDE